MLEESAERAVVDADAGRGWLSSSTPSRGDGLRRWIRAAFEDAARDAERKKIGQSGAPTAVAVFPLAPEKACAPANGAEPPAGALPRMV
jgi:hypothetical protein